MIAYETRSMDSAGDEIVTPHARREDAVAHARLIHGELGAKAHVWQRESGADWVRVWPERRWWPWAIFRK